MGELGTFADGSIQKEGGGFSVEIKTKLMVTEEDIDDIMVSALEGGISYWCRRAEVVGEYLGEYASEQISRGGSLNLYDYEAEINLTLTLEKFLKGLKLFVELGYDKYGAVSGGKIDTCEIDGDRADCIIQLALYGEVIYA